jgi:hypothetical protein
MGLQARLHLADLVEENSARVRHLEETGAAALAGSGESALDVTEELALQRLSGSAAQLIATNGLSLLSLLL